MKTLLCLIVLLFTAAPAYAEIPRYKIDHEHTRIFLKVNHAGFAMLIGEATQYHGYFTFDESVPEASSISIDIPVIGLRTSSEKLDEKLRGDEYFDAKNHPLITFRSAKIRKTGENTGTVDGDLSIKGVSKPFVLDVTFNKAAEFMGKYKAGFSATGTLKRSDYGLDKHIPAVSDEVIIEIEIEAIRLDKKVVE